MRIMRQNLGGGVFIQPVLLQLRPMVYTVTKRLPFPAVSDSRIAKSRRVNHRPERDDFQCRFEHVTAVLKKQQLALVKGDASSCHGASRGLWPSRGSDLMDSYAAQNVLVVVDGCIGCTEKPAAQQLRANAIIQMTCSICCARGLTQNHVHFD